MTDNRPYESPETTGFCHCLPGAHVFVRPSATLGMVDFQSRDTTRGLSSDDEDDSDDEEAAKEGEAEAEETSETAVEQGEAADAEATDAEPVDAGTTAPEPVDEESVDAEATDVEESTARESGVEQDSHDHDDTGHDDSHDDHAHSHDHDHDAHHHGDVEELGVAVVTVSSSRSLEDDPSGDAAQELLEGEGHSVVARDLVVDDLDGVQRAVLALTGREDVDVVVTTGGTGVTPDDVTVEAVEPLFDKDLPGFGELFRILSYEEVGTRAMGSRATAGVSEGVPVFCLPGSEDAVRTGVEELILAEAPHLVGLANGD
jgi:molybdenum cofactor biosynthesis protein B